MLGSIRKYLSQLLWSLKVKNKNCWCIAVGSNNITSYCNITNQIIDYIAEQSTSLKLNMFTPTTHIKIIDEKNMIKKQ